MNLTPAEYARVLKALSNWTEFPASVNQPDPDFMVETRQLLARLQDIVHPPVVVPPTRFVFADLGDNYWLLGEGDRLEPVLSKLEGMRIAYRAFQAAIDPNVLPMPPEFFCDGLQSAGAVRNAINTASEFIRCNWNMRYLAAEVRQVRSKLERDPSIGLQLVRYRGKQRIETTCDLACEIVS
ncbi:hypothetical protein BH10PSE17_BH10PSE17_25170 [soil metagenome]